MAQPGQHRFAEKFVRTFSYIRVNLWDMTANAQPVNLDNSSRALEDIENVLNKSEGGGNINAIKRIREYTSAGLKDSKDFLVETFLAEKSSPEVKLGEAAMETFLPLIRALLENAPSRNQFNGMIAALRTVAETKYNK